MYTTGLSIATHQAQMAKEQVEYLVLLSILRCKPCDFTVFHLCDIDNNWALLLFTSCTLLTLSLDLVGGMGTGEADPSHFGQPS